MTQFRGRFQCKVDSKGRLKLPSAYRQTLASDQGFTLVFTNGLYKKKRCLDAFTLSEWENLENKINKMPALRPEVQAYQRFYLASGQVVDGDSQDRVLLPAGLRKYAEVEEEVMLVGMGNKFEVWPLAVWQSLYEGLAENYEDILSAVAALEDEGGR